MELPESTARMVSASLLRICQRNTFFATLALFAPVVASSEVPTAATDGRSVYINPAFFDPLSPAQQDGLLLHEVLHAALLHLPRRGGREPLLWNIAADIVINGMVLREGYALPDGGMRDPRREHLGVEEIYDLLLREAEQQQSSGDGPADLLDGPPADAATGEGQPAPGDQAANEGYWRQAHEQARALARQAGTMPGGLDRELANVAASKLDWRAYLWRYLTETPSDFTAFDRRFVGRGLYLETLGGESVNVLLCVDTSGSVDQQQLTLFLNEARAVLRSYPHMRCDLYFADTQLHGPFSLRPHGPLPTPIGGGGTDFRPFFAAVQRHPFTHGRTVAVYLTDGYGLFPAQPPRFPTLWIVTPGGEELRRFPFGAAVRLLGS